MLKLFREKKYQRLVKHAFATPDSQEHLNIKEQARQAFALQNSQNAKQAKEYIDEANK